MATYGWGTNEPIIAPEAEGGENIGTVCVKIKSAITDTFTKLNSETWADASTTASGYMSASDKIKLNGIETGAEVNQFAFSNISVGGTTISADTKQDTLTLVAGTGITLTPDAGSDKVTIETGAEVNQFAFSNISVGGTTISADTKQDTLTLVAGTGITLTPDAGNDKVTIQVTNDTYLPLSGGTMTGILGISNRSDTNPTIGSCADYPIRFLSQSIDGAAHIDSPFKEIPTADPKNRGSGLLIQTGGLTMISSGESGRVLVAAELLDGSSEKLYLTSENDIRFVTACQHIANRKEVTIDASGNINAQDFYCKSRCCYFAPQPKVAAGVGQITSKGVSQTFTLPSGGTWEVWGDIHNSNSTANGSYYNIVAGGTTVNAGDSQSRTNWFAKRIS